MWKALVSVAAFVAAWAAREAAHRAWAALGESEGPVNPADRTIAWSQAIGWAALIGLAGGVARVLGRRGAAAAWERATGEMPPGLETA